MRLWPGLAALLRPGSRWPLVIGLVAVALVGVDLGDRVLATNDEARFVVLADRMLGAGEWLFPRLGGVPYHNKPLLLAWLIALASWPFGEVSQATAAVPSAAAAVAAALALGAFGRELFGTDAGRYAALVAVTTQGFFLHARLPLPDMLMTAFMIGAVWMLWRALRRGAGRAWAGFYGLTAGAFWAKGPAGLLPLAVALAWALAARGAEPWRRLRLPAGLGLLLVAIAPWYALGLADPAAFATSVLHDQLLWWMPRVPGLVDLLRPLQNGFNVLFPWVLVVPVALVQALRFLRGRGAERDAVCFLLLWAAVVFVAVAVGREQRLRYYVPLVAPAALLLGWWWSGLLVKRRPVARLALRWYLSGAGAFALAMLGAIAWKQGGWRREVEPVLPASALEAAVLAAALALIALAVGHVLVRNRLRRTTLALAWAGSALLLMGGYHWAVARRNTAYDYPGLCRRLAPLLAPAPALLSGDVPELPLSLYCRRPVVSVEQADRLRRMLVERPGAVALVSDDALARLGREPAVQVLTVDRLAARRLALVTAGGPGAGTRGDR